MKNDNTITNAAREAGQTKLPNYRIYDGTGGGVTEDIYAESLEDAIEAGRDWIEAGDWERDEMETPLECCVREIVRVPDLRSIEALPGVWGAGVAPDAPQIIIVTVDNDALSTLIASVSLPGTITQTIQDNDGSTILHLDYPNPVPQMIDEAATLAGDCHDCSGVCPAKDAPECRDEEEHDWQSPYSLVGGCESNPGVCGSGHGRTKCTEVCAHCGLYRTIDYGASNPSNGERATRVSYEDADEKSEAWAAEQRGEGGVE